MRERRFALKTLSWCVAGLAALIAGYSLFASWAVNAESFGRHDAGLALFFAFSSAYALIACLCLAPASAVFAFVAWLTKKGSALALLLAAAASALPFLLLG